MKKYNYSALLFLVASLLLSSCEAIGNIFEAGIWVGVIIVVVVVALIIWLIRKIL
jgi:hypothetical protein